MGWLNYLSSSFLNSIVPLEMMEKSCAYKDDTKEWIFSAITMKNC